MIPMTCERFIVYDDAEADLAPTAHDDRDTDLDRWHDDGGRADDDADGCRQTDSLSH